MSKDVGDFIC